MRNTLFAFALVMAASVHFTHQLFPKPDSPTQSPAYQQPTAPPSTYRAAPSDPGDWLPPPSRGNESPQPAARLDLVDAAPTPPSVSVRELASSCREGVVAAEPGGWLDSL